MNLKAMGALAALALGSAGWADNIREVPRAAAVDEGKTVLLKDIKGKVIGFEGETLFIEQNGVSVPLRVTPGVTALNGEIASGDVGRRLEQEFGQGQQVRARVGIQDLNNVAVSINDARRR